MPDILAERRHIRHGDIIPKEKLKFIHAVVVGVGAIGGQVAVQLAHIGVPSLTLIDPDTVDAENLGPQGFFESDIGRLKVRVVRLTCEYIDTSLEIVEYPEKFALHLLPTGTVVVFMCVDDMDARLQIFNDCQSEAFIVDGRMSAELIRILTITDSKSREYYRSTLFTSAEAHQESCTSKSTIYCANVAAGLMVAQFTKWLRGFPMTRDFEFNLLSLEFCDEQVPVH